MKSHQTYQISRMTSKAEKLAKLLMKAENCSTRKKAKKHIAKAEKLKFYPQ